MHTLAPTVASVEPDDPEYGDYKTKVIAELDEATGSDPIRPRSPQEARRKKAAAALASALAADPDSCVAGRQFRVRAHR